MEWLGLSKKSVREAHEFGQKVVRNATALEEHCQSTLDKLVGWKAELDEKSKIDQESLKACKSQRQRFSAIYEEFAELKKQAKEFLDKGDRLEHVLGDLKATSLDAWLSASLTPDESNGESLFSFVDQAGIDALRAALQDKAKEIDSLQNSISELEQSLVQVEQEIHNELFQVFPTPEQHQDLPKRREETEEADKEEDIGFSHSTRVLSEWIQSVDQCVKEEGTICYAMSSASMALGALYNHFLRNSFQTLSEDTEGCAETTQNLEKLYLDLSLFINQRLGTSTVDNESSVGQVNLENMESVASGLRECTRKSHDKFKQGLKSMANLVADVKSFTEKVTVAHQSYNSRVREKVQALADKTNEAVDEAEKLTRLAESLRDAIQQDSMQFDNLEHHYKAFLLAHEKTEGEIRRRWDALAEIEKLARKFQSEINLLVEKECQERAKFHNQHGLYLPAGYCPALAAEQIDLPTSFQFVLAHPEDAHLLHECIARLPSPSTSREGSEAD